MNREPSSISRLITCIALLLVVGLAATGCSTSTLDNSDRQLEPLVTKVCDRHDAGVKQDPTLSIDDKTSDLVESATVRKAFAVDGKVPIAPIYQPLMNVCRRQDTYVLASPNLTPLQKHMALTSTDNIRATLNAWPGAPKAVPAPASKPTKPIPPIDIAPQ